MSKLVDNSRLRGKLNFHVLEIPYFQVLPRRGQQRLITHSLVEFCIFPEMLATLKGPKTPNRASTWSGHWSLNSLADVGLQLFIDHIYTGRKPTLLICSQRRLPQNLKERKWWQNNVAQKTHNIQRPGSQQDFPTTVNTGKQKRETHRERRCRIAHFWQLSCCA